eukprot:1047054-Pelagomonas_calceolata.AAC.5
MLKSSDRIAHDLELLSTAAAATQAEAPATAAQVTLGSQGVGMGPQLHHTPAFAMPSWRGGSWHGLAARVQESELVQGAPGVGRWKNTHSLWLVGILCGERASCAEGQASSRKPGRGLTEECI